MIAESAVSAIFDDIQQASSSFGETQGLYGKYYVQEGVLKIFKINEEIAIGFAGDMDRFYELLGN